MIFSNKKFKISSGKNATLFAEKENIMNLYVFNNLETKNTIELSSLTRCFNKKISYPQEFVTQLNSTYLLGGSNGIISIFKEDEIN